MSEEEERKQRASNREQQAAPSIRQAIRSKLIRGSRVGAGAGSEPVYLNLVYGRFRWQSSAQSTAHNRARARIAVISTQRLPIDIGAVCSV
jgi:hypothetical protein